MGNSLGDTSVRHPYSFVALLTVFIAAVYVLAGAVTDGMRLPEISLYFISNGILALAALILLARHGWWQPLGFVLDRRKRDFLFFILPLAPAVLNSLGGVHVASAADAALFLMLGLLIAFVEESFFRGFMLRPLALKGPWRAAIATSLIFGLMHSQHLLRGTDALTVLAQMGFAVSIGFTFSALVLRTGMIWPVMIIHFLTDFVGFMAAGDIALEAYGPPSLVTIVIFVLVFAGYGVWLLSGGRLKYYRSGGPGSCLRPASAGP